MQEVIELTNDLLGNSAAAAGSAGAAGPSSGNSGGEVDTAASTWAVGDKCSVMWTKDSQ